jgi:hypothetical protein
MRIIISHSQYADLRVMKEIASGKGNHDDRQAVFKALVAAGRNNLVPVRHAA